MNGVIKSDNLGDLVRPLALLPLARAPAIPSRQEEEINALHQRVTILEKELRSRDEAIEKMRGDVTRAFEDGKIQGHEAGLSEAQDRQYERLSLLEQAIRGSQGELSKSLASLERLSALLARECLDIILGDGQSRADLLQRIITTQIESIDKAMLLGIDLSREDFPDDEALKAVANAAGLPGVTLMARAEVPSGGCIMNLRLGRMDIGIDQQWGVLREMLDEIALHGGGA